MKYCFIHHQDPGHGWVEVPKALLRTLNITGISRYSYMDDFNAYLEEDCDAGLFLATLKDRGFDVELVEDVINNDSPIRNMMRYAND